jgi:TetR/AcrR family tetracycline transcriptional repressor
MLRKADVVGGALRLLETEGLDGLTTRKLGDALGVRASALYRHFPHKQALLDAMAEGILEEVSLDLPPGTWAEQGAELAGRLRRALLAHRDGARVVAGAYVTEAATVAFGNTAAGLLEAAGLPRQQAGWATAAVSHYVLGHTIEEQARAELADGGAWAEKMSTFTRLDDHVALAAFDALPTDRFAYGLRLLINGIRHELADPGRSGKRTM